MCPIVLTHTRKDKRAMGNEVYNRGYADGSQVTAEVLANRLFIMAGNGADADDLLAEVSRIVAEYHLNPIESD